MGSILNKTAQYEGSEITLADAIYYARINECDTYNRRNLTEAEFYNKVAQGIRNSSYADQYGFIESDWQAGLTELGY